MKILLAALFAASAFAQQNGALFPAPRQQPLDNSGRILGGACMYTYDAGTTNGRLTYSDSGLSVPNANPTRLDAFGRLPAVYLSPVAYKFVFAYAASAACPVSPGSVIWSQDNVYDFGQLLKAVLVTSSGAGLIGFEPTGGSVLTNVGAALNSTFIYDIGFTSGAAACASTITVAVTKQSLWNAMTTQTCGAPLWFPTGAGVSIQPASGQKVKLTGSITAALSQIFDLSLGGTVDISQAGIETVYPEWLGAKCDGTTDDTVDVQAAINITGIRTLTVASVTPCIVSSLLYIPASSSGMTIRGAGSSATGGGLKAKSGASAFTMLRVYAFAVQINDLYINCNSTATHGLVIANGSQFFSSNINVGGGCAGDVLQINPYATPTTTLTSNLASGSSAGATFTVAAAVQPGITLGVYPCTLLMLDYGTANQELLNGSSSGNTYTLSSFGTPTAHTHSIGSVAQCGGNNDNMTFLNPSISGTSGTGTDRWGVNIFQGSDENDIAFIQAQIYNNYSGGILVAGSGTQIIGSHFENNSGGPAAQIGDASGGAAKSVVAAAGGNGRTAFGTIIGPFGDDEGNGTNGIVDICGVQAHISPLSISAYIPTAGASPCPALPSGVNTAAVGPSVTPGSGLADWCTKTSNGMMCHFPGVNGGSILQYGADFSTLKNCYGLDCATNPAGFPNPTYFTGAVYSLQPFNTATETSGSADNALVVTLNDATGTPLCQSQSPCVPYSNMQIQWTTGHTLQIGANTLTYNGTSHAIHSNTTAGANCGTAVQAGVIATFAWNAGASAWVLVTPGC